jgi:cytochrome c oxidase subunit 2
MGEEFSLIPVRASTIATQIDGIFFTLCAITIFFSALIACGVIAFAFIYRRRPGVPSRRLHEIGALEVAWSVIPLIISLGLFFWGAKVFVETRKPPPAALDIYVTGKQWMWKFQHPRGPREINALHLPMGRPIRLTMASEDVIHSLFVPAFRVKTDVIPGRYTIMWFEATQLGRFHLFCAEYCGTKHSEMIGWVEVMTPQAYQQWLAGNPTGATTAERGAELFSDLGCASCHKEGPTARGPTLTGLYGKRVDLEGGGSAVADEAYLRESIVEPMRRVVRGYQPVMPTFTGQVSEEQILQLVAYIRSVGTATATQGAPP